MRQADQALMPERKTQLRTGLSTRHGLDSHGGMSAAHRRRRQIIRRFEHGQETGSAYSAEIRHERGNGRD
jgi:hypothetical protein